MSESLSKTIGARFARKRFSALFFFQLLSENSLSKHFEQAEPLPKLSNFACFVFFQPRAVEDCVTQPIMDCDIYFWDAA